MKVSIKSLEKKFNEKGHTIVCDELRLSVTGYDHEKQKKVRRQYWCVVYKVYQGEKLVYQCNDASDCKRWYFKNLATLSEKRASYSSHFR